MNPCKSNRASNSGVVQKLLTGAFLISIFAVLASGQATQPPPQLTLADILIALRSKKLTLPERNKILTDAVMQRGITFAYSNEIEVELQATGADEALIGAIKRKSPIVKTAAVVTPPVTEPKPAPPPEWQVFQQRADASVARGDYDAAVVEYGRAIELRPTLADAYFSRGLIYLNKTWWEQAIADFSKVVELNPKDAAAFINRAKAWEKKGDAAKAKADYQSALAINADNAAAKAGLARIEADEAKALAAAPAADKKPAANPTTAAAGSEQPVKIVPTSIDLGTLSSANAVRMVKPTYSPIALRSNISGKVTVKVTLDEEGNVTSAKAIDGHQLLRQTSEDAAMKSKFKPAMYEGKPIRSTGTIVYNYDPQAGR
ncbi:MAG: TonB family protein [Pyrinomonadaceae bacterium]